MWNSWSFFLPPYQRTFSGLPAMSPAGPFHHISLLKKIQKSLIIQVKENSLEGFIISYIGGINCNYLIILLAFVKPISRNLFFD